MVYAYDNWIQLPTKDLYDTRMMAMAINAAKDMYDRGQEQVKDFYTKYGDFMSPFSKDLERYGEMMGGVRNIIDDAAARGIDLFKTPEGRAVIQRAVYSVNPAEYNRMRTNAKVGFEYLDAVEKAKAKNEFNQAFEDWTLSKNNGGPGSFNEFSSAGGAMWNRPAPYTYQDLNQFTGHIFDKMEDSFIRTGEDHYDYYGVSREDRAKALTQHLSGLLSQPLGRFHYENSKAAYENALGRKLSDDEAMKYWQRDILDSTQEYEHRNRKLNEMWKLQFEDRSRQRAAARSAANNNPSTSNQYSIAELIRRTSSTRIVGQQTQEYGKETLAKQRDQQIQNGSYVSKMTGGHSNTYKGRQMFKNMYQDNNYSASVLTNFVANQGFKVADDEENTIILPKHSINRLSNLSEIQSKTTGYRGAQFDSKPWLRKVLKDADEIRVTFTGGNYGAYMKNATNQNHFESIVKVGKKVYNDQGQYKYEWTPIKSEGLYFDSHITSQPDDPRSGYLGTPGKDGKVNPTPNIPITNSQDTKYQDAVMSDVYTTSQYVKGSDYNFDAPYTELTGYPYNTTK